MGCEQGVMKGSLILDLRIGIEARAVAVAWPGLGWLMVGHVMDGMEGRFRGDRVMGGRKLL